MTTEAVKLYSSMRFEGDGVTKVVALTFDLRKEDRLTVDFGEGILEGGYVVDFDSQPVLVIFDEPLPKDKTITIRRRTDIDRVPYVFQVTGNAQGGSPFNAFTIDTNFDLIVRASQDAMDSQVLASETLEEIGGIRDESKKYRDEAKEFRDQAEVSKTSASSSALFAGNSAQQAEASKNLAYDWANKDVDIPVLNGEYSAKHWADKAKESAGGLTPEVIEELDKKADKDFVNSSLEEKLSISDIAEEWGGSRKVPLSQYFLSQYFYDNSGVIALKSNSLKWTMPKTTGTLVNENELNKSPILRDTNSYGTPLQEFIAPYISGKSTGVTILQTVSYDYSTGITWGLRSTGTKSDGFEDMQFLGYLEGSINPIRTVEPSPLIEHQCFGIVEINGGKLFVSGVSKSVSGRSHKVAFSDYSTDTLITDLIDFNGSGLITNTSLNNVTSDYSQSRVMIQGVSTTSGMLRILVFDAGELKTKGVDAVPIANFEVVRQNTRYPQSVAFEGNYVYLLYGYAGEFRSNIIEGYSLSGERVVYLDNDLTGKSFTDTVGNKYYEPEGLFFKNVGGVIKPHMLVAGAKRVLGNDQPHTNFTFEVGGNVTNVETIYKGKIFESEFANVNIGGGSGKDAVITLNNLNPDREAILRVRNNNGVYLGDVGLRASISNPQHGLWSFKSSNWLIYENVEDGVLHIGRQLRCRNLIPQEGSTYSIGSTSNPYNNIYLTNQPIVTSDSRLKENVGSIDTKYFEVLNNLSFKSFNILGDDKKHFGIVAQEWIEACVECGIDPYESGVLVGSEGEGFAIRYGELQNLFNAYLLEKIKEI